jgi:hypothetical protein
LGEAEVLAGLEHQHAVSQRVCRLGRAVAGGVVDDHELVVRSQLVHQCGDRAGKMLG